MSERLLVAIDTATRTAGLAIYDGQVVAETTWLARENHTVSLMPQFERLLKVAGFGVESIAAVAVATGPGSFTGLRIGLSLAKGLALVRGLPIVGVPTLDALAYAFAWQEMPMWGVIQAGRGRYAAAAYRFQSGLMERESDYVVADAGGLVDRFRSFFKANETGGCLVCGEVDERLRQALRSIEKQAIVPEPAVSLRRGGYLAALAWRRWQAGQTSNLESLVPYYIPTASLPQAAGA